MSSQKRFFVKNGLDNNSQTIINVLDPVNAQDAATKNFSSNASNLTAGTLAAGRLPAFTGDATTTAGSSAITLSNSGVVSGTYNNATQHVAFTVDAKGRITSVGTATTITPAFSSLTGVPTTIAGYGLTDAQALNAKLTSISGLSNTSTGLVKLTNGVASFDSSAYLTGNQTVAVSGDATGSGATAITLTLANSGVTAGTYTKLTVDAKGRATVGTTLSASDIPNIDWSKITSGTPTTISGYGITDAYTKTQVDSLVTGLDSKASVRALATSNITLSGTQTIDGVAVVAGDRVLVTGQTLAAANGIYVVASGAWSRATDADANAEVTTGMYTYVEEGTTYGASGWVLGTTGTIVVGNTALTFNQFNGLAQVTAGTGLAKSGNTINMATITQGTGSTFAKITLNSQGQVTGNTAVAQADITGLLGAGSITNTMLANGAVANLSGTNTGDETLASIKSKLGITTLSGSNTGDQTITLTGDATGSGNGSFVVTLANSGVSAGTYNSSNTQHVPLTVDAKGRVTSIGTAVTITPAWSSITSTPTTISGYGITDAQAKNATLTSVAGLSAVTTGLIKLTNGVASFDSNTYLTGNQSITVSGDASGAGSTAITLTLGTSGVTAGTYGSTTNIPVLTVDAKGRITSASTAAVSIPSGTITLSGDVTASGTTGATTTVTLANSGVTAGTYNNSATQHVPLTVDAKGRVTGTGTAVTITPAFSSITGTPTTLSGYGITNALALTGGTLTGALTLAADPTSALHAATKQYVDNSMLGLDAKASVVAATTANITLSGTQTVDGVALVAGDRVLVKNQSTTSANGIYLVASGSWTRTTDMAAWSAIPGSFVFVEKGTTNGDTGWLSTADASGTLDTTAITWSQFSGAGAITAGTGITVSGNQVSLSSITQGTGSTFAKITVNGQGQVTGNTAVSSSDITTALGFTPVQQGGGTSQLANKVYIGWSTTALSNGGGSNSLRLQIDGSDYSNSWPISVTGTAANVAWSGVTGKPTTLAGYGITDAISTGSGGVAGAYIAAVTTTNSNIAAITTSATDYGIEARGNGTGPALMTFHRPGIHAAYLGLDTDNKLKYGGWTEGANAYEMIHSGNLLTQMKTVDGSGSGLDADMLDGKHIGTSGSTIPVLDTANTWSSYQVFPAGIVNGGMGYPTWEGNLDFMSSTANTWLKIISANMENGAYSSISFKIEITDPNINWGSAGAALYPDLETYFVSLVRSDGLTLNTPDTCYVYGPSDRIRAIKTAVGTYEVHIQNETLWREYHVKITPYAYNGSHTISYHGLAAIGTATATYNAIVGQSLRKFEKVAILDTTASTSISTGSLVVSGGVGITGALNVGGSIGLPTGAGYCYIGAGTGDGASYTTYNTKISSWWGIGMATYDGSVNGYYDARTGTWDVKGGFKINGVALTAGGGATKIELNPSTMFVDDLDSGVDGGNLFNVLDTLDFSATAKGSLFFTFAAPSSWATGTDIKFDFIYALNGNDTGKVVKLIASVYVINMAGTATESSPTATGTDNISSSATNMGVLAKVTGTNMKVPAANFTSTNSVISVKITRDPNDAVDTYNGTLQLTKVIAYQ